MYQRQHYLVSRLVTPVPLLVTVISWLLWRLVTLLWCASARLGVVVVVTTLCRAAALVATTPAAIVVLVVVVVTWVLVVVALLSLHAPEACAGRMWIGLVCNS